MRLQLIRIDVNKFAGQVYEGAGEFENMTEHDNDLIVDFEKDRLNSAIQKSAPSTLILFIRWIFSNESSV